MVSQTLQDVRRVLINRAEKSDRSMLVDLKNGKLLLKQKPMSLEKMSETMQGAKRSHPVVHGLFDVYSLHVL